MIKPKFVLKYRFAGRKRSNENDQTDVSSYTVLKLQNEAHQMDVNAIGMRGSVSYNTQSGDADAATPVFSRVPDDPHVVEQRLSQISPYRRYKDDLARVIKDSHCLNRQNTNLSILNLPKIPHTLENDRHAVGEIDYLRNKLGLCMPTLEQTLATQTYVLSANRNAQMGFLKLSDERVDTMQELLSEENRRSLSLRPSGSRSKSFNRVGSRADSILFARTPKRGLSEAQQYVKQLMGSERRSKFCEEKIRFSQTKDLDQLAKKHHSISEFAQKDDDTLDAAKYMLLKEVQERKKKKILKQRAKNRMYANRRRSTITTYSETISIPGTELTGTLTPALHEQVVGNLDVGHIIRSRSNSNRTVNEDDSPECPSL